MLDPLTLSDGGYVSLASEDWSAVGNSAKAASKSDI
jgi:hypothetical protein